MNDLEKLTEYFDNGRLFVLELTRDVVLDSHSETTQSVMDSGTKILIISLNGLSILGTILEPESNYDGTIVTIDDIRGHKLTTGSDSSDTEDSEIP